MICTNMMCTAVLEETCILLGEIISTCSLFTVPMYDTVTCSSVFLTLVHHSSNITYCYLFYLLNIKKIIFVVNIIINIYCENVEIFISSETILTAGRHVDDVSSSAAMLVTSAVVALPPVRFPFRSDSCDLLSGQRHGADLVLQT